MNNGQEYINSVRGGASFENMERDRMREQSIDEIRAAGLGERMEGYDLAALKQDGMPPGTKKNVFAEPGKVVGRFEAHDAQPLAMGGEGPRIGDDDELRRPSVLEDMARMFGSAVYDVGADVWHLSADLAELMGEDPAKTFRPPYSKDLGIAPERGLAQLGSDVLRHATEFGLIYNRLGALAKSPTTIIGRTTQMSARTTGAVAGTEAVALDPREYSIYHAMRSYFGLEHELAKTLDPAELAEQEPMLGRAAMAAEGVATAGVVGTAAKPIFKGVGMAYGYVRSLWHGADAIEQTAVRGLAKQRHTTQGGLEDEGWLTTWMGSRIMKGETTLTEPMREALTDTGATQAQIVSAWNRAAKMAQEANREATVQAWRKAVP